MQLKMPNGLDYINSIRARLNEYIQDELDSSEDFRKSIDAIVARLAVARSLDIASADECTRIADSVVGVVTGQEIILQLFDNRAPSDNDLSFADELTYLKLILQERLNSNLDLCDNYTVLSNYTKEGALKANDNFLKFALDYNIITNEDYSLGIEIIKKYRKGQSNGERFVFVRV